MIVEDICPPGFVPLDDLRKRWSTQDNPVSAASNLFSNGGKAASNQFSNGGKAVSNQFSNGNTSTSNLFSNGGMVGFLYILVYIVGTRTQSNYDGLFFFNYEMDSVICK